MQAPDKDDRSTVDGDPTRSSAKAPPSGLKLLIDLVPLLVFFTAFRFLGLVQATAVLVVATLLAVAASRILLGRIDSMLIVTACIVTVFGGLTFFFDDPSFIKMKPTVVNVLFAGALGFGLVTGRNYLKSILGEAIQLTDQGWRLLTVRWIAFFLALALLNEVVWRSFNTPSTEYIWVNFKVFGILALTILYLALQAPLLRRHALPSSEA